jgi:hypothetical protein
MHQHRSGIPVPRSAESKGPTCKQAICLKTYTQSHGRCRTLVFNASAERPHMTESVWNIWTLSYTRASMSSPSLFRKPCAYSPKASAWFVSLRSTIGAVLNARRTCARASTAALILERTPRAAAALTARVNIEPKFNSPKSGSIPNTLKNIVEKM